MFTQRLQHRSGQMNQLLGWRPVGHLWWPDPLLGIQMGPLRSQSASNDGTCGKNATKDPLMLQESITKSQLVRDLVPDLINGLIKILPVVFPVA